MVGQLVVAQFDLEVAIAALTRSGGDAATAQTQLQNITQLRNQIGTASPTALAALRSEIVAAVAQSQSAVQEARSASSGGSVADVGTVASLANHAREQASSFMRDVRQYDDLLQFDSDADRDAYRQREEERRKRYEAEAAKGTPEGTLNANGAALGQVADLAAHGGSADPALMRRLDDLADSTAALRAGMIRDGKDVSKFDENMRDDLRAIMRSKGKSDAEIDTLLAAHPDNPMDAIKAFVQQDRAAVTQQELDVMAIKVRENQRDIAIQPEADAVIEQQSSPSASKAMVDIAAKLRASGVRNTPQPDEPSPDHGVSAQVPSSPAQTLVRT